MDPTTTEAVFAVFTPIYAVNSHRLCTRDERSVTVDVITISTSVLGVFIAVVGLIQGYKYWKHNCKHNSSTSPVEAVQSASNPPPNSIVVDAYQVFGIAYAAVFMFLHNAFASVTPSSSPTAIRIEPDTPRVYDLEANTAGLTPINDTELEGDYEPGSGGRIVAIVITRES